MKIIVAPDKFKGSLTSFEACNCFAAGIKQVDENAEIHCFPMADGGDGFAAVLQHYWQTQTINCPTVDPLHRSINASYQWDEKNKTAIIELAAASGLVLLEQQERNPLLTSALGTGFLIKDAITKGAAKIILGVGGSATNDAGTGILSALGFIFSDEYRKTVEPCGGNLLSVQKITVPDILPDIQFDIACDVQNPLYGENGAAFIYGPQKGAGDAEVLLLDDGLRHFHHILSQQTGKHVAHLPGTGAAGGVAAGLMCFFDVRLSKGIDMIVAASGIEKALQNTNLVITGEGKIDAQSKEGKVISRIAALAKQSKIPVLAFCGSLQLTAEGIHELGLDYAASIINEPLSLAACISNADNLLQKKTASAVYFFILQHQKYLQVY